MDTQIVMPNNSVLNVQSTQIYPLMDKLPSPLNAFGFYRQFIGYVLEPQANNPQKMNKIPFNYNTLHKINAHNPENWMSADEVIIAAGLFGNGYGTGFVFTENDPFCFLDIDNCLDKSFDMSTATPIALELIAMFPGAAIEISSSGKGLHLFFSYKGSAPSHANKHNEHKIELYTKKRFVALTGIYASGDAATDHTDALHKLIITYFPERRGTGNIPQGWETQVNQGTEPSWNGPTDDNELIKLMLNSKLSSQSVFGDKASFRDLWERNIDALVKAFSDEHHECGYDESSADSALACHLAFWTGKNAERTMKLMWLSELKRDKWERVDYLPRTILRAFSMQQKVFAWRSTSSSESHQSSPRNSSRCSSISTRDVARRSS